MKFSKVFIAVLFACSLAILLQAPVKINILFLAIAAGVIGSKLIIDKSKKKKVAVQTVRSR